MATYPRYVLVRALAGHQLAHDDTSYQELVRLLAKQYGYQYVLELCQDARREVALLKL